MLRQLMFVGILYSGSQFAVDSDAATRPQQKGDKSNFR
jgi:hypothetical protein